MPQTTLSETGFQGHQWLMRRVWQQKQTWIEYMHLWNVDEVEASPTITDEARSLGIIKRVIYRDGEVYSTVQVD